MEIRFIGVGIVSTVLFVAVVVLCFFLIVVYAFFYNFICLLLSFSHFPSAPFPISFSCPFQIPFPSPPLIVYVS